MARRSERGRNFCPSARPIGMGQPGKMRAEQLPGRVEAEERGEEHRDGREVRDLQCGRWRHAACGEPVRECVRQRRREADDGRAPKRSERKPAVGPASRIPALLSYVYVRF